VAAKTVSRDSTRRFADRVDDYVRTRPSYPASAIDIVVSECELASNALIADIGSGTGISTQLFLARGFAVAAVEPNDEMRAAAESWLGTDQRFNSVNGRANATSLADASIDLIVAAQAFHWFEPASTTTEWRRILKAGGHVALLWNDRETDSTEFLRDYEALLQAHAIDYAQVDHKRIDIARLERAFGETPQRMLVANVQRLDVNGLISRAASSSYLPGREDAAFPAMAAALSALHARYAIGGFVELRYRTIVDLFLRWR
jgi:SAM-dependent methyltransferase